MESLLLLALFLLLPLIEQLVKFARRRVEAAAPGSGQSPAPIPDLPPAIAETGRRQLRATARPSPPLSAPRQDSPATVPPPARRRRRARQWLHSPAGLRRAVVLMTILGPCRALEADIGQRPPA